ncbi:MAG: ABC transporter ATP-binding protein [Parvibaculaceae bacterium]
MQLVARNIGRKFGGLTALRDVSLALSANAILGLIGPNGAGKSTLTNVLSGVLPPTTGRILIGETDVTNLPEFRMFRLGVARTFQNMRLFADMTVFENVEVAASSVGKRGAAREETAHIIDELGLSPHAHSLAAALPYGIQKLTALGRALAGRPRYLLLDEPAAGLNEVESAELMQRLKQIRKDRSLGIMLIDHDLPLIMGACDRIVVLANGEKIAEGTPEQVRADAAVIKAYLGSADDSAVKRS